jgi:hypothetical protein
MNRKWKTAEEVVREMEADPVLAQRLKEKANRIERRTLASNAVLEPVVRQANELGYRGDTIEAILKLNAPLPGPLVSVLLASLGSVSTLGPRQQESIVRALGGTAEPFDASPLVALFNQTQDYALKWAIVNTFALANPNGIEEWFYKVRGTYWEKTFAELKNNT